MSAARLTVQSLSYGLRGENLEDVAFTTANIVAKRVRSIHPPHPDSHNRLLDASPGHRSGILTPEQPTRPLI